MFARSVIISALVALTAAAGTSSLESFLHDKVHDLKADVHVGHGHKIHPGDHFKRDNSTGLGNAILGNRCDHDIYVWSVDGTVCFLSYPI